MEERGGLFVNDGPLDVCFGCGQQNESGLRMTFRKTSETSVETTYSVSDRFCGKSGVVHGGIQAALLDEVMGFAVRVGQGRADTGSVTAEFALRYRRAVPTETPLTIKGWVSHIEEPNYFVEAEIVGPGGEVLTTAQARWRDLGDEARRPQT